MQRLPKYTQKESQQKKKPWKVLGFRKAISGTSKSMYRIRAKNKIIKKKTFHLLRKTKNKTENKNICLCLYLVSIHIPRLISQQDQTASHHYLHKTLRTKGMWKMADSHSTETTTLKKPHNDGRSQPFSFQNELLSLQIKCSPKM